MLLTDTVQLCNWNDADEKKTIQKCGKMQISDGRRIRMRQWTSEDEELWD